MATSGLKVIDPAALPPAQAVRLEDLLDYASGGVVSRVLTRASGESVLVPANLPHSVRARGRFKMLLTMIRQPGLQ
jgi:hypothetical protein